MRTFSPLFAKDSALAKANEEGEQVKEAPAGGEEGKSEAQYEQLGNLSHSPINEPAVLSTYVPMARNAEEFSREITELDQELTAYSEEGSTNKTASLARVCADFVFLGTPALASLRDDVKRFDKLEFVPGGKIVSQNKDGVITRVTVSYYDQIFQAFKERLGEEAWADTTIRALISGSIKKAILLAYGIAEIGVFERRKNYRLRPSDRGVSIDDDPNFDPKAKCKAIAVSSQYLAKTLWQTQEARGSAKKIRLDGTNGTKDTTHENKDVALYYLTTELAKALYALHIEKAPESAVIRSAEGYLERLAPLPTTRETAGTQNQTTTTVPAANSNTTSPADAAKQTEGLVTVLNIGTASYEAYQAAFRRKTSLDSGDPLATAFLQVLEEQTETSTFQVQPWAIISLANIATNIAMYVTENYTEESPPSFAMAEALANLMELSKRFTWAGDNKVKVLLDGSKKPIVIQPEPGMPAEAEAGQPTASA